MTENNDTRMKRLGYRAPSDVPEPDQPVLVEYLSGGSVALITLNRPHADNAITTELAAARRCCSPVCSHRGRPCRC